jgi:hypothetical protein
VTEGRRPGQVCVDPKTECLTKRGWKKYTELLKEDEIYCFDPNLEKGIWSPLIGLAVYNWDDDVYTIQTDRMDCVTTSNHGWCVGNTSVRGYTRVEMKDLHTGHFIPNKVQLSYDAVSPKFHDAFVELVGWIITEGCFNVGERKENGKLRYRVIISQSKKKNKENCSKIYTCLKQAPFPFSTHEDKRGSEVIDFVISGEPARLLMEWFPEKKLTYKFINQLSTVQLELLYETMLRGDGSRFDPSDLSSQDVYYSSDKELADQFQMIAVLIGKATNQREGKPDLRILSHKKEYYGIINKVSCRREEQNKWRTLLKHRQLKHHKGVVWCPQTLTGTWIARRNGITYLTGNTSGVAIEQLATMAQTTIRLKARQLEGLIQRIGQKLIPRIFAYYTTDRIFNLVGNNGKPEKYLFQRQIIRDVIEKRGMSAFRDYQFKVVPTSSLAITKWQKGLIATQLFQLGLIDHEAALEALEWPNRDEMLKRMQEQPGEFERKKFPMRLPANLLRGGNKQTALQEPQVGK